MGWGDALIAAGLAQDQYALNPTLGPVTICDQHGRARWNPVWQGNPAVYCPVTAPPLYRAPFVCCGEGCLPYLQYPYSTATGWTFTRWRVRDHRPRLFLTPRELALGDVVSRLHPQFILVEPTSPRKHPNRRPPPAFWPALVDALTRAQLAPLVQLAHRDAQPLDDVPQIVHANFRAACGILASAALLICTEGGLAHAAAALGVPALVLWGGNVSAEALGYPEQLNFASTDPPSPCGALHLCAHCAAIWADLTPDFVVDGVLHSLSAAPSQVM